MNSCAPEGSKKRTEPIPFFTSPLFQKSFAWGFRPCNDLAGARQLKPYDDLYVSLGASPLFQRAADSDYS